MENILRTILQDCEDNNIKRAILNFKGTANISYKGNRYIFYSAGDSYVLRSNKRTKREEIETLANIISSAIGIKPICFYETRIIEKESTRVNSNIEWNLVSPEDTLARIRKFGKKVLLYPTSEEYLIKTWGLNSFCPILFGCPTFSNFEERIKKCDEADLYLIIETLARYNLCVDDKTWNDRKHNKSDINRYFEMAILQTNRFIEDYSYPINRDNPNEIVHTKEFFCWFYDWKEYFGNNEIIAHYLNLKSNNPNYHISRLRYSETRY